MYNCYLVLRLNLPCAVRCCDRYKKYEASSIGRYLGADLNDNETPTKF